MPCRIPFAPPQHRPIVKIGLARAYFRQSTSKRQNGLPQASQSVSTARAQGDTRTWNNRWNTAACQVHTGVEARSPAQSGLPVRVNTVGDPALPVNLPVPAKVHECALIAGTNAAAASLGGSSFSST
jgi:hypothetical protein